MKFEAAVTARSGDGVGNVGDSGGCVGRSGTGGSVAGYVGCCGVRAYIGQGLWEDLEAGVVVCGEDEV